MAEAYKVLAQSAPLVTTLTDVYVVPAATSAVVSSISVCNNSATPTTFRISIAKAGVADTPKQYLYYDLPIAGNDTFVATIGGTLATTDVIRCYAGAATLAFNILGVEVS